MDRHPKNALDHILSVCFIGIIVLYPINEAYKYMVAKSKYKVECVVIDGAVYCEVSKQTKQIEDDNNE